MSDNRGTVREVVWDDLCPWLILVRALRVAVSPRLLLLAALAVFAVTAGWRGIGLAFQGSGNSFVETASAANGSWPWDLASHDWPSAADDTTAAPGAIDAALQRVPIIGKWLSIGPATELWRRMSDPFVRLLLREGQPLDAVGFAYLLLCSLWAVLVWALFAGAMTRIAALALVRHERLGPKSALGFAARKYHDFVAAPLLPLGVVGVVMIPLLTLGFLLRLDAVALVAGLLWPLVLVSGFLLAILLIGLLAGWPLLWPAISVERGEAFDAASNCYAYVYQRPLHYAFYLLIALLVGLVGGLTVNVFAGALLDLSAWAVSWGSGAARLRLILGADRGAPMGWMLSGGAALIRFWTGCVVTAQLAFFGGFFWTAATAIYLLLRRAVDAKEMDEISLDDEAATEGLAPLADTETGVPEVADC